MSLTASPIRRYGSSSLKMRSPISAISAGIASRQHSACSDILPSAPISVIFLLLPPLSFYHPLLFQQTLLYRARGWFVAEASIPRSWCCTRVEPPPSCPLPSRHADLLPSC